MIIRSSGSACIPSRNVAMFASAPYCRGRLISENLVSSPMAFFAFSVVESVLQSSRNQARQFLFVCDFMLCMHISVNCLAFLVGMIMWFILGLLLCLV